MKHLNKMIIAAMSTLFILLFSFSTHSQNVSLSISGNTDVEFTFNTITKLTTGIIKPNAFTIEVESTGPNWDLYAGTVTSVAGTWDNSIYYTTSGNGTPPVSLLQIRLHNLSNTPLISTYVASQDIASTTLDFIGNHNNPSDPAVNCSDINHTGTNTPGSYTTDPQCYQFKVDLKITPGLTYRPGVYNLQLEFILAPDL
jgi:hypothetical protein